ncbi:sugar ABC transporter ATP-binding protein [Halanaerobium sp. ST460_2HS_T2]|uniref:sugar ABC transporter ATP-binding protein n=1 Tax=Halanaerobium sp. ST460_2HS_T2 TaxID=2183914 RepID=UPI000798F68D|nr:sugar ABC transporter ATP-binding protein [Halanaerobium sp. ST460_2HS_T2]KXS50432.1 MAG: putative ABC transporter ATP-binding protein [Halanaerobium sp. T82-1]RCW62290.1 monosaccharide ABC transporter ATP-binding protein (CUT2 family) [Halanaerobium sp. ST460_2HS_T2]
MEDNIILQLRNITKTYPGVTALDNVSLDVKKGEVHALVGENGAGKSTLIKTCTGAISPNKGEIVVEEKEFSEMTPKLSEESGISVIYQEFNLVGELSVAENIFLGNAIRNGVVIDRKRMVEESQKIFDQLNIDINPKTLVKNLTVGYQQIVEIAKALSKNAKILIMDEPSAPLTKSELKHLFEMVDKLKKQGVTIIYISHRLDEVFRLGDRVTVIRDGEKIKTLNTDETNVDELITLMVGRELKETFPPRESNIQDDILLEVNHLTGNGVYDCSFNVKKGEVLGFGGLIGAGRTELAELIFGYANIEKGEIIYKGKKILPKSPREAIDYGIALLPEDRKQQGALLDIDVKGNISMAILKKISSYSVVNKKKEKEISSDYRKKINIKTPSLEQTVKNLSGGNQQKVVIAKWLAVNPDLIILDEPTRGIDVGAKFEIYKLINQLVEEGKTIILISSEMEELIGMSDRIMVLAEGEITGMLEKEEFSQEKILNYASKTERESD